MRAATAYARTLPGRLPVVVYGISMGAAAVLKADAEAPLGARALVLECPFDRLLTTVDHRFEVRHVPAFPLSNLLVFWGGWRQGFDAFAHNPVDYARRVRTPTLLFSGSEDELVTPEEADGIARALAGPGGARRLPGRAHASCLRGRTPLARDALARLLDGALGGSGPAVARADRPHVEQALQPEERDDHPALADDRERPGRDHHQQRPARATPSTGVWRGPAPRRPARCRAAPHDHVVGGGGQQGPAITSETRAARRPTWGGRRRIAQHAGQEDSRNTPCARPKPTVFFVVSPTLSSSTMRSRRRAARTACAARAAEERLR